MAKFSDKILVKKKENDEVLKKIGVMAKKSLVKKSEGVSGFSSRTYPRLCPPSTTALTCTSSQELKNTFHLNNCRSAGSSKRLEIFKTEDESRESIWRIKEQAGGSKMRITLERIKQVRLSEPSSLPRPSVT